MDDYEKIVEVGKSFCRGEISQKEFLVLSDGSRRQVNENDFLLHHLQPDDIIEDAFQHAEVYAGITRIKVGMRSRIISLKEMVSNAVKSTTIDIETERVALNNLNDDGQMVSTFVRKEIQFRIEIFEELLEQYRNIQKVIEEAHAMVSKLDFKNSEVDWAQN